MTITDTQIVMTRDEIVKAVEAGARRCGYPSARALARAYRQKRITEAGEVARVALLLDLLPAGDPLFVAA